MKCEICGHVLRKRKKKVGKYSVYVCFHCKGPDGHCREFFVLDDGKDYGCYYFQMCALMGVLNCEGCRGE